MQGVVMTLNPLWSWLPEDICHLFHLIGAFLLTYVALKTIQLFKRQQELVKALRNFPGPPSHWFYGHAKMFEPGEDMKNLIRWTEEFPQCHSLYFGPFLKFLVINHPEYAQMLFSRGDPKSLIVYKYLVPWIGKGLLILNGPKWQKHRKLLTPGFHYEVLKPYVALMADSVKVMLVGSTITTKYLRKALERGLSKWEKQIQEDRVVTVEMFEHVSLMAFDSIMKCAFSCQSNCQTDRDNPYIKTVYDLSFLAAERLRTPLHHSDFFYQLSSEGRQFRKACRLAHLHTDSVIKERKESLKNERELEKILKKRRLDFLDILLCAKDEKVKVLSDEDLRAEVDTFMFEGHDTTASGISWLFYCMAENPEHQQRCREEIKKCLGPGQDIQWNNLGKLTYSTMCIKESLRLYPSVPLIARILSTPVTFSDGRTLPSGTLVGLNIVGLHRNPEVWNDPNVFEPLRFSPENSSGRHPYAFLPFSAGPRNCIGQQFAMMEMKVALALTLLQYELLLDPANLPVPVTQIIMRSKNGIHLKLKKLCSP